MSEAPLSEALPLATEKTPPQRRRALVVADSTRAGALRERLTAGGYAVVCASADEAGRVIPEFSPEVALIAFGEREDESEFLTVARRLRAEPATYALPLVFLYESDERTLRNAALNVGADDYFACDVGTAEICARLDALFWRAEAGRRAAPIVGDQRLEIDNFLLLLDAVSAEAERSGGTGAVALIGDAVDDEGGTDAERASALAEVHGFFKLNLRRIDGVAFYGPSILMAYLPRMDGPAAQRMLAGLRAEFLQSHPASNLAVGVAAFPSDGSEIERLIEKAEVALGVAREEGAPSRVVRYGEEQSPPESSLKPGNSQRRTRDGNGESSTREAREAGGAATLQARSSARTDDAVGALTRSAAEAGLQERERRARGAVMPRRLLLAVSDAARMAQLNLLIRSAAYEVRAAFDGQQALSLLRIERPDLLLVDHELHDMDGVEMLRRLRKQSGGTLRLPALLLLPREDESVRREALEVGARAIVGLPYDPVELLNSIRTVGSDA